MPRRAFRQTDLDAGRLRRVGAGTTAWLVLLNAGTDEQELHATLTAPAT